MARPRSSTSGGQFFGLSGSFLIVVAVVPAAEAIAAIIAAVEDLDEELLSLRGFQFRNAVHILHGLPSGPMTIPGGNGRDFA